MDMFFLRPVSPKRVNVAANFDMLSLLSPSELALAQEKCSRVQLLLGMMQQNHEKTVYFSNGTYALYEYDYSKSWKLHRSELHAGVETSSRLNQPSQQSCSSEYLSSILSSKCGKPEDFDALKSFMRSKRFSSLLMYGCTPLLLDDQGLGQNFSEIHAVEQDRPTCFNVANTIWESTAPGEIVLHCETKEKSAAATPFSMFKEYVTVPDNAKKTTLVRSQQPTQGTAPKRSFDVVLVSGVAQFGAALFALRYLKKDGYLIMMLHLDNEALSEQGMQLLAKQRNIFLSKYYKQVFKKANVLVFQPESKFIGMSLPEKDIHFLHFIDFDKYMERSTHNIARITGNREKRSMVIGAGKELQKRLVIKQQ